MLAFERESEPGCSSSWEMMILGFGLCIILLVLCWDDMDVMGQNGLCIVVVMSE